MLFRTDQNILNDPKLIDTSIDNSGGRDPVEPVPATFALSANLTDIRFYRAGGLGVICKAKDENLHRQVAIKLIRKRFANDPQALQQFAIEAEITSRLDHPGVVPVLAAEIKGNVQAAYAMRFIEGHDLNEEVDNFYQQPDHAFDSVEFRDLLQKFISVCKTIAYAHNRGIVHRDIKPQNIRVGKFGETVVLDWGLAVIVDRSDEFKQSGEATMLLASGANSSLSSSSGVGTPAYMSPEQLSGLSATPASDIYSLGATLYKIATGHSIVDGLSEMNIREALIDGRWKRIAERQPSLPKQLAAICEKALSFSPADRYSTAIAMSDDIERFLAGAAVLCYEESPAEKVSRLMRKHQQWLRHAAVGLIALVIASVCVAVYTFQLANNREQQRQVAETERNAASLAKTDAMEAKQQAQLLSAQLAAKSIATEIELRGSILREEASNPRVQQLVSELNADPKNDVALGQLNNWLRDRYLDRVTEALPTSSWAIYNAAGIQLARVAPRNGGDSSVTLGKSYRHRDYFHALGHDFQPESVEASAAKPHAFDLHVSAMFISTNTKRLSVAFTVPVFEAREDQRRGEPIGIFFASVQLNRLDLLPNSLLIDTRSDFMAGDERGGLVLRHPDLEDIEGLAPNYLRVSPEALADILKVKPSGPLHDMKAEKNAAGLIEIEDPLSHKAMHTAVEPVFLSNQDSHTDTGWVIVLRDATRE